MSEAISFTNPVFMEAAETLIAAWEIKRAARVLNLAVAPPIFLISWDSTRFPNVRRWYGIGFPVCALLFIYLLWRSTLSPVFNTGIDWRGTHYTLAEPKANKTDVFR